jgi:molybdopterin synthase catalytic subunit
MAEISNRPPRASEQHVQLVRGPLDPTAVLAAVAGPTAGGNVLFVGTTRAATAGVITTQLEYEAHESLAVTLLEVIRCEAIERFGLVACRIEHRLGPVEPGEASVVVAVSSPHRREAFAASEWLMHRIKQDVPIWKREHRPDGSGGWVHGDAPPLAGGRS